MSDEKGKPGDIARHIWLAGVGAYGRAVEEAQGRLEKAMEPPKLFRDLVKAGAALEEEARETTEAARQSVEDRINKVRDNFHNQRPARHEDLDKLNKKIDQLTRKVNKLSKALSELGVEAGGARKASASGKRPSVKPAKKKAKAPKAPRKKKATGKKPAARKKVAGSKTPARKHSA